MNHRWGRQRPTLKTNPVHYVWVTEKGELVKRHMVKNYWFGKRYLQSYYGKDDYFYSYVTDIHKLLTQIKSTFGRGAFIKHEAVASPGPVSVGDTPTSTAESPLPKVGEPLLFLAASVCGEGHGAAVLLCQLNASLSWQGKELIRRGRKRYGGRKRARNASTPSHTLLNGGTPAPLIRPSPVFYQHHN